MLTCVSLLGVEQQYGIYSETPDKIPLVGTTRPDSHICYLLGTAYACISCVWV